MKFERKEEKHWREFREICVHVRGLNITFKLQSKSNPGQFDVLFGFKHPINGKRPQFENCAHKTNTPHSDTATENRRANAVVYTIAHNVYWNVYRDIMKIICIGASGMHTRMVSMVTHKHWLLKLKPNECDTTKWLHALINTGKNKNDGKRLLEVNALTVYNAKWPTDQKCIFKKSRIVFFSLGHFFPSSVVLFLILMRLQCAKSPIHSLILPHW